MWHKTSLIALQVFVFDKTYHLILRDSALVYTEIASSVHHRVLFFKVHSFVDCFPTVPFNKAKLKRENMKLKAYKKIKRIIELWCNISSRTKGFFFSAPWACALSLP